MGVGIKYNDDLSEIAEQPNEESPKKE